MAINIEFGEILSRLVSRVKKEPSPLSTQPRTPPSYLTGLAEVLERLGVPLDSLNPIPEGATNGVIILEILEIVEIEETEKRWPLTIDLERRVVSLPPEFYPRNRVSTNMSG